ncbi:MAG: OsmC family protein [Sumerlaeia bacterium]
MAIRTANALWNGTLKEGNGTMKMESGAYEGPFTFKSRFENGEGTNPEELIAAAHAGCFSMALSAGLGKNGFTPKSVETSANVHLEQVEGGFAITKIVLECRAVVPEISAEKFQEIADGTKTGCPVSKALSAVDIELKASLSNG